MLLEGTCLNSRGEVAVCAAWQSQSTKRNSLLILLFGVIVFTLALAPEFISFDARFALFAQEMLRKGPSFFPTTYGTPYPDYQAVSTLLIYLVSLPLGRVTPFTAVLPTAVVSALVLVVTYQIGALHSRRRGLAAVLFTLFTAEFLAMSRSIALDQYATLATVLSFYLVYSSDCLGRRRRLWLLPVAWALGFAFRSPVGLLIPAAVTCVYHLRDGQFKRMLLTGRVVPEFWAWLPVFIFVPIAFMELDTMRT
ncbi:MAG: glycosyltransferase family 39 protein [Phycisphaerales bacterium]